MSKKVFGLFVMALVLAMVYWSHADTLVTKSGAPANAPYITKTPVSGLTGEQALSALATGCLSATTTTGVVATRILTGTTNQIGITNTDCSANPVWSLSSTLVIPGPGIEFSETAGDQTCAAGNYWIKANSTTGNFRKCQNGTVTDLDTSSGGAIGGTVGTTDEAIPVANGTGGSTLKASTCTITNGAITCPNGFNSTGGSLGLWVALEGTAPGAATNAGEHNVYVDSTTNRLASHENGGSAKDYLTAGDTQTVTGKTFDCEATGNVCGIPRLLWIQTVICNNATPVTTVSLPTAGAPTLACVTGTNTQKGVMQFPDSSTRIIHLNRLLPSTWTGAIDVRIPWNSSVTTGTVVWQAATACTAVGSTDDPAFNTSSTVATAANGVANALTTSTISGIITTGCAAGNMLHVKLYRDSTHASDNHTGTAQIFEGVELTIRESI